MTDVLILREPAPLVLPAPFGLPGSTGDQGPAGDVAKAATRAALAAIVAPEGSMVRYLTEADREGIFVFSSANLSALVTVDTNQGLFVAPISDGSGASGAWVRKFTGAINPRWFGILDGNTGAVNLSAYNAMKATLKALSTPSGAYASLRRVSFPDDKVYNFNGTLEIDAGTMHLTADVPATPTTGATLKFPAGVTGIRDQRYDTSGATANTGTGTGGDSAIIERLRIVGGYVAAEGDFYGVHIRGHGVKMRDNYIDGFQGDGVYVDSNNGGNANCEDISNNIITNCRNGIYLDGSNSQAGQISNNDVSNNRQWGIWGSDFLGNTLVAGIAENCGICAGTYTPSMCSYTGKRYAVIAGQEVGASTNAPSGTTAHNTWWYYVGAGAADTVGQNIPAWVTGMTWRAGGPIRTDNNNAAYVITGFYAEVGQGPMQLVWPTLLVGGHPLSGFLGVSWLRHDDSGVRVDGTAGFGAPGAATDFTIGNGAIVARTGHKVQYQDADPPTSNWVTYNAGGNFLIYSDQAVGAYVFTGGSPRLQVDANGIAVTGYGQFTKGLKPNVVNVASATSITPTFDDDQHEVTALAANLTVNNLTGTTVPAKGLSFYIKDNGTSRTITWGTMFRGISVVLPAATTAGKRMYVGAVYNQTDGKMDVVAVQIEA